MALYAVYSSVTKFPKSPKDYRTKQFLESYKIIYDSACSSGCRWSDVSSTIYDDFIITVTSDKLSLVQDYDNLVQELCNLAIELKEKTNLQF